MDNTQLLRKLALEGLKEKGLHDKQEYKDRLLSELRVIEDLGFAPYFLVMWDIAKFVKDNGILAGPGRGSAAGGLLCYCLEITSVDPIKYGLYFERFLNKSRFSSPKIEVKELPLSKFSKEISPSTDWDDPQWYDQG